MGCDTDSMVLVRYPDAPSAESSSHCYEKLYEYGRFAVVFGRIPHRHGNNGQYHAYLVVNTVRNTIDHYSASEAGAISSMLQLEGLMETALEALAHNEAEDFAEEDAAEDAEDVGTVVPNFGTLN